MKIQYWGDSALSKLHRLLGNGSIPTVRVSSAQARGYAKQFSYWGVARGEIRNRKSDGHPVCVSIERAGSDRRSLTLAHEDADSVADNEGRIFWDCLGEVTEPMAKELLSVIEKNVK